MAQTKGAQAMKKPPKRLYVVCCGTCGAYIAAEPRRMDCHTWGADRCPPDHWKNPPTITGPYELANPYATTGKVLA